MARAVDPVEKPRLQHLSGRCLRHAQPSRVAAHRGPLRLGPVSLARRWSRTAAPGHLEEIRYQLRLSSSY